MKYKAKSTRPFCLTETLEQRRLLSAGLSVTYATSTSDLSGLATLSYNNTQLINEATSQEQFQVARYYTLNSDGSYTTVAGGSGFTHVWNPATDTLTYTYSWGTLTAQYSVPAGSSRLNIAFTVNNAANSGVTLGGVVIYPAYVHFPGTITPTDEQQIAGAASGTAATPMWAPETAYGIDGPAVLPADYSGAATGAGVMDLVNDGPATQQMYTSLWTTNYSGSIAGQDYFIYVGTAPKDTILSDAAADTSNGVDTDDTPIEYTNTAPGGTSSFEISLRFGPAGTNPTSLATDIETQYSAAYPQLVNWPDTRPIGSIHLASEGEGTSVNPNAWDFGGSNTASQINVKTTAGLNNFSAALLAYAQTCISNMTLDHSQGMITWDLEGEQYPQPNPTYIGDPTQATTIAPELNYNYQGNGPLINQYFALFTKAGFRVGVTLRPTSLTFTNGVPSQTPNDGEGAVPIAAEISNLETKIAYAYAQWGCTLFYVDSTTGFDSAALRAVQAAYPNVLIMPEHQTISTFGTAVAYGELANDFVGTPSNVLATYPTAKSLIYIADGNMSNYQTQLISSLSRGDMMLFRSWYSDPNNAIMENDYAAAMAVPTQVSLVASGSTGDIKLSWSVGGANAVYNITRATSVSGPYTPIAYGVFGTSYSDTTVTNYQTYYYMVTAVNGAGNAPASAAATATAAGPSVATSASASPSTVTGTSTNLSVLGSDTGGESTLTYTWTSVSTPSNAPPVTFSANGTNSAKNTTAYFYQAGSYVLTAKIADSAGYSTTSQVTVTVAQTVQSMYVLPPVITLAQGGTQQYGVTAHDQYSNTIFSPTVTWSVSGGGTISSSGLFTAGSTGGTYKVTAVSGAATASTNVTVQSTAPSFVAASVISAPVIQPINIGDADLIVADGGAAGLSEVQTEIKQGEILSSTAAADTTHLTAVGVILNNDGSTSNPQAIYTSLDGLPTALNDVLAKYTYYGDTNLDGKVDGSDYTRIDSGYLTHATGWANGDFNGDGLINGSDYTLIDNAFNTQGSSLGGASHAASISALIARNTAQAAYPSPAFSTASFASTAISNGDSESSISAILDELKRGKHLPR